MERFEGPFKKSWFSHAGSAQGMGRFVEGGLDLSWRPNRWSSKVSTRVWRTMLMCGADTGPPHALWWGAAFALRARSLGWPMLGMFDHQGSEAMKAFLGDAACDPSVVWEWDGAVGFEDASLLAHGLEIGAFCGVAIGDPRASNSQFDQTGASSVARKIAAMAKAVELSGRKVLCVLALSRLDAQWEEALAELSRACGQCPHGSRLIIALGRDDFPTQHDLVFGRASWFDTAFFTHHDLYNWDYRSQKMREDPHLCSFDEPWSKLLSPLIDSGGFDPSAGYRGKLLHGFDLPSGAPISNLRDMPKVLDSAGIDERLPMKLWAPARLAASFEAKQIGSAMSLGPEDCHARGKRL